MLQHDCCDLVSGHDTTSTTLGWCMYALAVHQDIQQKVYEDVCPVLGNRTEVKWYVLPILLSKFIHHCLFVQITCIHKYIYVPARSYCSWYFV